MGEDNFQTTCNGQGKWWSNQLNEHVHLYCLKPLRFRAVCQHTTVRHVQSTHITKDSESVVWFMVYSWCSRNILKYDTLPEDVFTSFTLYFIPSLRWNWTSPWKCKSWRLIRRWQSAWRWQRALQMLNNRVGPQNGLLALARTHMESRCCFLPSLQPSSTIQWKTQTPEETVRSFILLWWEQL